MNGNVFNGNYPIDIPNNNSLPTYNNDIYNNPSNNLNNINTNTSEYAQNILKKNVGRKGYFFVSFPDSVEWRDKIFYGTLTSAGQDYLIVYNEDNNESYLIWSIYLNYATFDNLNISK